MAIDPKAPVGNYVPSSLYEIASEDQERPSKIQKTDSGAQFKISAEPELVTESKQEMTLPDKIAEYIEQHFFPLAKDNKTAVGQEILTKFVLNCFMPTNHNKLIQLKLNTLNNRILDLVIVSKTEGYFSFDNSVAAKGASRCFKKAINLNDTNLKLAAQLTQLNGKNFSKNLYDIKVPTFHSDHMMQIYHVIDEKNTNIVFAEYLNGGHLGDYIIKNNPSFDEKISLSIQALQGLADIHKNGYMHRDVKTCNFMLYSPNSNLETPIVKIADLDTMILEGDPRTKKETSGFSGNDEDPTAIGTLGFIPIESYMDELRTRADDIYAFGISLKKEIFPEVFKSTQLTPKQKQLVEVIELLTQNERVNRPDALASLEMLQAIQKMDT